MSKYVIAYKQSEDSLIYLKGIGQYGLETAFNLNEALSFKDEEISKGMMMYINSIDNQLGFKVYKVSVIFEEII